MPHYVKIPHSLLKEFDKTVSQSYGLSFDEFDFLPLQDRIHERMSALNIKTPEEYLELIKTSKKEITNLVDLLTINVTSFFRIPKHFKLLREYFLPEWVKQKNEHKKLRIWSAGCSNGPEPYSIAMEILDFLGVDAQYWDIKILASDISFQSLVCGQKGVYKNALLKDIPHLYKKQFCILGEKTFQISQNVRDLITWDYHNLLYDNGYKNADMIFCRNVLYYFPQSAQKQVLAHFHKKILPESPLFLGSSEYLAVKYTDLFESKKINGVYYYQKV